jgi:putative endonuclease
MNNQKTGLAGEQEAAEYLERKGYVVLDRRYRFERSEVDLVCFEPALGAHPGGEFVFVEVKTRTSDAYGSPDEVILPRQRKRIAHAARAYMYERNLEGAPARFDVVAIRLDRPRQGGAGDAKEPRVKHYKYAFTA